MNDADLRTFLYRLATEPAYRDRFEKDPVGTAEEVGIVIPPSEIPVGGVKLPASSEILANLDRLVQDLIRRGPPGHMIFFIWRP